MINGTLKYLMIALSAVFLWGSTYTVSAQEIEATALPMKEIDLFYKNDEILLTLKHAEALDYLLQHMRYKPAMKVLIFSYDGDKDDFKAANTKRAQARAKVISAYLRDNGADMDRISIGAGPTHGPLAGVRITPL